MPASRTAETLRPAQRGQIVATGPFAGEACLELEQVAWIILHEGAYYILGSPESSGYPILQILSVTLFEKMPVLQALQPSDSQNESPYDPNQLILFDF